MLTGAKPRHWSRALALLGAGVILGPTAACTADAPSTPADPAEPATCLTGSNLVTDFAGVGTDGRPTTGRGGNLVMTFRDGKYQLVSDGLEPITLAVGAEEADLFVNGVAAGAYEGSGSEVTLRTSASRGSATLQRGTEKQTLALGQVAAVLVPEGPTRVTCTDTVLTLATDRATLTLRRG